MLNSSENYNYDDNEYNIFTNYETSNSNITTGYDPVDSFSSVSSRHVMFDPLTSFKNLNKEKMNNNLRQDEYKNITPWKALTEIIAVPAVMLVFITAVKINIFIKIVLIVMIVIHIIISTCLVSYLSKSLTTLRDNNTNKDENLHQKTSATSSNNQTVSQ